MKKFIGKKVEFVVEGFPSPFMAKVVGDSRDMVLVKGDKDDHVRHLIKSKICSFMSLEDVPEEDVSVLVLYCENPSTGCCGVNYIKEGPGFSRSDFDMFMKPCESRRGTCRTGSRGDLKLIEGKVLKDIFSGNLLGDYPESKKGE